MRKIISLILLSALATVWVFAGGGSGEQASAESVAIPERGTDRDLFGKIESIDQMLEFKALPSYQEAPSLLALVAAGKLPPVEERLPAEPLVWKNAIMVDGVGEYGDQHRRTYGSETQGWNWAAGQITGWGGTSVYMQEYLVRNGPMWMLDKPEPIPNLAKSWEWSADGKSLTMHLVEGARWSDGVEFTAEDVMFTYHDNFMDPNVPSRSGPGTWTYGGNLTDLEQMDKYTIRFTFGIKQPIVAFFRMDPYDFSVVAAHIYKPLHPKYNSKATYESYLAASPPDSLPAVALGAFVPVAYKPNQQLVYVRNPYYWHVDEAGNQLPYFDEILFTDARDWSMRTLNVLAGSCDLTHVQAYDLQPVALAAAQNPDVHFTTHWGNWGVPHQLELNLSSTWGVDDDRDRALRELFRTVEFRQALSYLVDRAGISNGLFPQPSTREWYGAYPTGSPMHDDANVVKYEFDPDRAKKLLADLGFRDTNGDGILNWPAGSPIAGDELIIEGMVGTSSPEFVQIMEALVPLFKDGGIDYRVQTLAGGIVTAKRNSGDWETGFGRPMGSNTPSVTPSSVGPEGASSPAWHRADANGKRELMAFEQEMADLIASAASMTSAADRKSVYGRIQKLYTENVYTVPIMEARYLDLYGARHRNMPGDYPIFLYNWTENNIPIQIRWTAKGEQLPAQFQHLIPTAETYAAK